MFWGDDELFADGGDGAPQGRVYVVQGVELVDDLLDGARTAEQNMAQLFFLGEANGRAGLLSWRCCGQDEWRIDCHFYGFSVGCCYEVEESAKI